MLYRSLDAVERLREQGEDVGLINKATLNVVDEAALKEIGSTGFVLVVESMNQKTALGSKVSFLTLLMAALFVGRSLPIRADLRHLAHSCKRSPSISRYALSPVSAPKH